MLKDRFFIRPLNFNDHRYELKNHIYRRIGDMVLDLYILASDENVGKIHDVLSVKIPKTSMQAWGRAPAKPDFIKKARYNHGIYLCGSSR